MSKFVNRKVRAFAFADHCAWYRLSIYSCACERAPLASFIVSCWFSFLHRALNATIVTAFSLDKPYLWKLFGRTCLDNGVCAAFVSLYTPDCYSAPLIRQWKWWRWWQPQQKEKGSTAYNVATVENLFRVEPKKKVIPLLLTQQLFMYSCISVFCFASFNSWWLNDEKCFYFCPFFVLLHEFSALLFSSVTPFLCNFAAFLM